MIPQWYKLCLCVYCLQQYEEPQQKHYQKSITDRSEAVLLLKFLHVTYQYGLEHFGQLPVMLPALFCFVIRNGE